MELRTLVIVAFILVTTSFAQPTEIDHDKVKPFAQPAPVTISEKAAIKFKPQLSIEFGCHPYPAVQADGSVSGGLAYSGKSDGGCKGSGLGSQVYARSTWHRGVWAIMYAWYLPKGYEKIDARSYDDGHRHFWGYATVWIDNPSLENAKMLGVSVSGLNIGLYDHLTPVDSKYLDGSSLKVRFLGYPSDFTRGKQGLRCVEDAGEFQDLITWNQLTEAARNTLNTYQFSFKENTSTVPLKDSVFTRLLNATWPFN